MEKLRLLLCDDHALMRNGMAAMFEKHDWIQVIGTVDSGETAVNFVAKNKTDIVLMDIVMSGMSGVEATRWIKEQDPSIKVVLVSGEIKSTYISAGIKAGADGYVLKHSAEAQLIRALRTVSTSVHFYSPEVLALVMTEAQSAVPSIRVESYSDKIRSFISLLLAGLSMRDIEERLELAPQSGKTFYAEIMSELRLNNMTDIVHYAIAQNIVKF